MSKAGNTTMDILECAICLGDLCQPRALPCLHSFCEKCLERHIFIQKNSHRANSANVTCPKCRESSPLPWNGVYGFKKDFRIVRMNDILSSLSMNINSLCCDLCSSNQEIVQATVYCLDCKKYLCVTCGVLHREIPVLLDHHLVDLSDPATGRNDVMCGDHDNESCRFFCETCNLPTCLLCILNKHKNHCTLDLNLAVSCKSSDMRSGLDRLSMDICKTREYMLILTQEQRHLENVYEESKVVMRKKSRKLVSKIMADESKFMFELEHNYQLKRDAVCSEKEKCHSYGKRLHKMKERVEHILRFENPSRINTAYLSVMQELEKINAFGRKIDEHLLTYDNNVGEKQDLIKRNFSNNEYDEKSLAAEMIPTSSEIEDRTIKLAKNYLNNKTDPDDGPKIQPEYQNQTTGDSTVKTQTMSNSQNASQNLAWSPFSQARSSITICHGNLRIPDSTSMLYEERAKRMSLVTAVSDKTVLRGKQLFKLGGAGKCRSQLKLPYSLCFTTDGMLVVAENGNKRLQIFDADGNVDDVIKIDDTIPRSVTALAGNKLAFTDEQAKTIKIYSGESHPTRTIDFKQTAFPYGITSLQDGSLVISDMIYENIQIVSSLGHVKLKFGSHGSSSNNRFDNPSYLASRGNNIFVSDSGNHEIKVFNDSGKFIFKFGCYGKGKGQMRYPKGIAVTEEGYIYVADSGNDRVVMFSPSGVAVDTVLCKKDGICRPSGIAYSLNGRLAVALPDTHEVRVYQLTPPNLG